ncbi:MAG: tetratricopeptide repeat protein [Chloroflexi bacterium]|nr:tetratricopeptide repeat protein [Chloroflexota bacterium]
MVTLRESVLISIPEPPIDIGVPASALEHIRRGDNLHKKGDFTGALKAYDAALEAYPELAEAHCCRGLALLDIDRPQEALRAFDRAVELRPNAPWAHAARGELYLELRRYDDARADFHRAIELQPYIAAYYYVGYGTALVELQRYKEALDALERAIEIEPTYALAHFGLGSVRLWLMRYQEALLSFDRAIALGLDNEETRTFRAKILRKLLRGLASGGRAAWMGRAQLGARRSLRLKPGSPTVAEAVIENRR